MVFAIACVAGHDTADPRLIGNTTIITYDIFRQKIRTPAILYQQGYESRHGYGGLKLGEYFYVMGVPFVPADLTWPIVASLAKKRIPHEPPQTISPAGLHHQDQSVTGLEPGHGNGGLYFVLRCSVMGLYHDTPRYDGHSLLLFDLAESHT